MAAALVQQLLAAGLSRYEPDPLRALAKADKAATKREPAREQAR
jgi:hypothetical protein